MICTWTLIPIESGDSTLSLTNNMFSGPSSITPNSVLIIQCKTGYVMSHSDDVTCYSKDSYRPTAPPTCDGEFPTFIVHMTYSLLKGLYWLYIEQFNTVADICLNSRCFLHKNGHLLTYFTKHSSIRLNWWQSLVSMLLPTARQSERQIIHKLITSPPYTVLKYHCAKNSKWVTAV